MTPKQKGGALLAAITLALGGCMNVASRANGEPGPHWQKARLISSQPSIGGSSACFYKIGGDTYTITSHKGCPQAMMIDSNSYVLHVDPLVQAYRFNYKCIVVEQCPSKAAEPIVAAPAEMKL